jgi:GrpB-like predicted nucleotidyltransferase (UPF0157 family)
MSRRWAQIREIMHSESPLGLERGTVRVVAYDTRWPELFAAESERIRAALGAELPLAIEHVGSTSVPGLAAKPVLDLLGGYPSGAHVASYIEALNRAGYLHRGEQEIPGREFFRRGEPRAYHLHLAAKDGTFWREQVSFRNALRSRRDLRDAYAALKLELGRMYPHDREAYINGKTEFVRGVLTNS